MDYARLGQAPQNKPWQEYDPGAMIDNPLYHIPATDGAHHLDDDPYPDVDDPEGQGYQQQSHGIINRVQDRHT